MDWRGEVLAGRYELTERLGRGGMGEVWAARDRVLHRDVALKVLSLGGGGHPELLPRFEREAVAGAQINHPNVAALYDQDVHEGMLFLVMEKVNGAPLTEYIQADSPLPLDRALDIAKEISEALVYAHQAVVHYDIKPHNVMLTTDGRVKVVDFGIAGFLHTQPLVARSSQLSPAGTPNTEHPSSSASSVAMNVPTCTRSVVSCSLCSAGGPRSAGTAHSPSCAVRPTRRPPPSKPCAPICPQRSRNSLRSSCDVIPTNAPRQQTRCARAWHSSASRLLPRHLRRAGHSPSPGRDRILCLPTPTRRDEAV